MYRLGAAVARAREFEAACDEVGWALRVRICERASEFIPPQTFETFRAARIGRLMLHVHMFSCRVARGGQPSRLQDTGVYAPASRVHMDWLGMGARGQNGKEYSGGRFPEPPFPFNPCVHVLDL